MIGEIELFQGTVLRECVVRTADPLQISAVDTSGRVNTYLLNGRLALHIKYSSKRLTPWQFTFSGENQKEIDSLITRYECFALALVCGRDGFVCLDQDEYRSLVGLNSGASVSIRADRSRNQQYRLAGTAGKLKRTKPRGVAGLLAML